MASGHVNRANRPNTWAHRPILQNVKKVLANSEPSTHEGQSGLSLNAGECLLLTKADIGRVEIRSAAASANAL